MKKYKYTHVKFLSIYSYPYKILLQRRKALSFIPIEVFVASRRSEDDPESSCILH